MTTIAYRDGVLASDSLVTLGSTKVHGSYQKIRRMGNHLVGTAGSMSACQDFVDWIKSNDEDLAPPKGEYNALIIDPKGRVREIENGSMLPVPKNAKFFAIGSGASYALAAMFAGASATEAVKIAAKIDTSTGLPVRSLKIAKQ
jgi:ATP-dependent protease HslVU (ClpYQ) peptidase subunit